MYLNASTPTVQLASATTTSFDSYNITITLTERQRVDVVQISGTPGGVGTNTVLRVTEHSFRDIAQNFNQQAQDVVLVETPDTTPPVPLNARIHYGTGVVMFNTSEILDVTPTTVLELTLLALRNDTTTTLERDRQFGFQTSDVIDLTGSTITAYDDTRTVFQLTESQRVHALAFSGTKGGDGTAGYFILEPNALRDVALNRNPTRYALMLVEEEDR